MDLTPDQIEAVAKASTQVIAAFGAVIATITSAIVGYFTYKNRRDLHIAHDRIRDIKGEPLQHRQDPQNRAPGTITKPKTGEPTKIEDTHG